MYSYVWLSMVYSNYLIETKLFFRSTSDLETFQNLILKYASKRNSYKPPAFAARNILATLDHNANVDREAVKIKMCQRGISVLPQNLCCIVLFCLYMYLFLFLYILLLVILIILPQHIYINLIIII